MDPRVFAYLKHRHITDTQVVNRLFVSAFVMLNRLNVRRNKLISGLLIKQDDEIYDILQDFISAIRHYQINQIALEDLVGLFEFVISPADRVVSGAVYTPQYIRTQIIHTCLNSTTPEQLENIRVADIACGCGGFLMDVALFLHSNTGKSFFRIYQESIFGIDVQDYSVERAKILLTLLGLLHGEDMEFQFNILNADTLDFKTSKWNRYYSNFDVIVGNPPYVCSRNVDGITKDKMLRYEVCLTGHPDLYIPFFQIAIEMLNDGGKLGYITMNSFIRSVNGRAVRNYISSGNHNVHIIDFRGFQVFKKKSTYTCLFFLTKNTPSDSIHYAVKEDGDLQKAPNFINIQYRKLDNKKGWSLNDFDVVVQMESTGIPIGKFCQSRHGIATLSNKIYIFNPIEENKDFYYIEFNHHKYAIEKNICRNVINSNKLNSEVIFEDIVEKLIFPYIIKDGRAIIINESDMKSLYPYTYAYLCAQRKLLEKRDKGKTDSYPQWYAYGRTQSLIMPRYKLFFPKFANKPLHCVLKDDSNLMLYNGIAFVSNDINRLISLKNVLESDSFWNYIVKNAKPYANGYYSLSGVDIKNYCVQTH